MADRLGYDELNSKVLQPLDKQIIILRKMLLDFDTIVLSNDFTISISDKEHAIQLRHRIKQNLANTISEHARISQSAAQI